MVSSHRQLMSRPTAFQLLLLVTYLSAVNGHPYDHSTLSDAASHHVIEERETVAQQIKNGQSIYGLGVRTGSYLQGFAFVVGILTLDSVDPKTQFSGIVLALQLTIMWFWRHATHELSASELWIGLAQLLIFTTPGAFLLFLSFSYQRRHWKTRNGEEMQRKEIVRGGGFVFAQVLIVLFMVQIVNIWFTVIVTWKKAPIAYPYQDPIWMWKMWQVRDKVFKSFLWTQLIVTTVLIAIPYSYYTFALYKYYRTFRRQGYKSIGPDEYGRRNVSFMHRILNAAPYGIKEFAVLLVAAAALFYIVVLIISIERTIIAANLRAMESLKDPGQLLPLISGVLAFVSSSINFTNEKWLKMAHYPVRIDTVRGKTLVFFKNGKLPDLHG